MPCSILGRRRLAGVGNCNMRDAFGQCLSERQAPPDRPKQLRWKLL
jgi:hypothetical protein